MKREVNHIQISAGKLKLLILRSKDALQPVPGILWIHGGGYMTGMAGMVNVSRGKDLAKKYGGVVVSPGYRLAWQAPYPAALEDCYAALVWMWDHAGEPFRIMSFSMAFLYQEMLKYDTEGGLMEKRQRWKDAAVSVGAHDQEKLKIPWIALTTLLPHSSPC